MQNPLIFVYITPKRPLTCAGYPSEWRKKFSRIKFSFCFLSKKRFCFNLSQKGCIKASRFKVGSSFSFLNLGLIENIFWIVLSSSVQSKTTSPFPLSRSTITVSLIFLGLRKMPCWWNTRIEGLCLCKYDHVRKKRWLFTGFFISLDFNVVNKSTMIFFRK